MGGLHQIVQHGCERPLFGRWGLEAVDGGEPSRQPHTGQLDMRGELLVEDVAEGAEDEGVLAPDGPPWLELTAEDEGGQEVPVEPVCDGDGFLGHAPRWLAW